MQPLLQWKTNKYYIFWVRVCSLRYSACNARVPYCHLYLCCVVPYISTLSQKGHDCRQKVTEHKIYVLIFSMTLIWNISHSKKDWVRYDQKLFVGLHVKCPLFLSDFNESWFGWQIFGKYCNMKFHENPSTGSPVVLCGWTDMMKLIVTLHNSADMSKNW
jgi:hypothetical protein